MLRCVNNNATILGFWKGWHASYNRQGWHCTFHHVSLQLMTPLDDTQRGPRNQSATRE
jgi:hypothetical protein